MSDLTVTESKTWMISKEIVDSSYMTLEQVFDLWRDGLCTFVELAGFLLSKFTVENVRAIHIFHRDHKTVGEFSGVLKYQEEWGEYSTLSVNCTANSGQALTKNVYLPSEDFKEALEIWKKVWCKEPMSS